MLPFLKHDKEASISMPIETVERKPDEGKEIDVLESAMEELSSALERKDYKAAADIFRSAVELMSEDSNG